MCNGNQQQFMLLNIQHRKLHVGLITMSLARRRSIKESANARVNVYGIISFAYRITHPQFVRNNNYMLLIPLMSLLYDYCDILT